MVVTASLHRWAIIKPAIILLLTWWPEVGCAASLVLAAALLVLAPNVPKNSAVLPTGSIRSTPPVSLSTRSTTTDIELRVERTVASIYGEAAQGHWTIAQVNVAHTGSAELDEAGPATVHVSGAGSYRDIRRALSGVLLRNPDLALDRLAISRRLGDVDRVDVEADWSQFAIEEPMSFRASDSKP